MLKKFEGLEVAGFLFTDVEVEGTLKGIRLVNVKRLAQSTNIPIIYAGGISSLPDLVSLYRTGVKGVVVGRALYDGCFTLKEAIEAVKDASIQN